jgi:hypothetical protein
MFTFGSRIHSYDSYLKKPRDDYHLLNQASQQQLKKPLYITSPSQSKLWGKAITKQSFTKDKVNDYLDASIIMPKEKKKQESIQDLMERFRERNSKQKLSEKRKKFREKRKEQEMKRKVQLSEKRKKLREKRKEQQEEMKIMQQQKRQIKIMI